MRDNQPVLSLLFFSGTPVLLFFSKRQTHGKTEELAAAIVVFRGVPLNRENSSVSDLISPVRRGTQFA